MRAGGLWNGFQQEVGFTVNHAEHGTSGHREGAGIVSARARVEPHLIRTSKITDVYIPEVLRVDYSGFVVARLVCRGTTHHHVVVRSHGGAIRPAVNERDDFFDRAGKVGRIYDKNRAAASDGT